MEIPISDSYGGMNLSNLDFPLSNNKWNLSIEDRLNTARFYQKLSPDTLDDLGIKIILIDISRPWRISEYDGLEFIKYFNGITVLDSITNYSKW